MLTGQDGPNLYRLLNTCSMKKGSINRNYLILTSRTCNCRVVKTHVSVVETRR